LLTRCRAVRWVWAIDLGLKGAAEAAPVQPDQVQAVSLLPARALPSRLDQPPKGGLDSTGGSAAPSARTYPSVRSADTAEPFPGGQPVKPRRHGCHPVPLPVGPSGPVRFLCSARSACRRHRCHPMAGLSPQHWFSARPSVPTQTTPLPLCPYHGALLPLPPGCHSRRRHGACSVRSQLLLSVLDVTRLCLDRSLGASPRFRRSEGRKAIRLRPSCRSGHSQACRP
jgi:hypothetical protein